MSMVYMYIIYRLKLTATFSTSMFVFCEGDEITPVSNGKSTLILYIIETYT